MSGGLPKRTACSAGEDVILAIVRVRWRFLVVGAIDALLFRDALLGWGRFFCGHDRFLHFTRTNRPETLKVPTAVAENIDALAAAGSGRSMSLSASQRRSISPPGTGRRGAEPSRNWFVEALATIAATSPRNLSRLFNEHTGMSVTDYVNRMRIALAREALGLLCHTSRV